MAHDTIVKTLFFAASRETVWDFLTKKDKLAHWFYPAEADLAAGETYVLLRQAEDGATAKQCWGKVLEWDPPSRLTYSFSTTFFDGMETTVSWKLESVAGGTRLKLEHSGIGATAEKAMGLLMAFDTGWDKHFAPMRKVIAEAA